jgi:hypothetical protein
VIQPPLRKLCLTLLILGVASRTTLCDLVRFSVVSDSDEDLAGPADPITDQHSRGRPIVGLGALDSLEPAQDQMRQRISKNAVALGSETVYQQCIVATLCSWAALPCLASVVANLCGGAPIHQAGSGLASGIFIATSASGTR